MNSRIEIVSECEVRICQHPAYFCTCRIKTHSNGYMDISGIVGGTWDREALSALRDCINCLEATGSFAALSDESA